MAWRSSSNRRMESPAFSSHRIDASSLDHELAFYHDFGPDADRRSQSLWIELVCGDAGGSPVRPRLAVEFDIDLCVIGAGLAGLTVACEVAKRGWSVVVLEAKSIAWSASGRNPGVVLPGFSLGADALIERVGLDRAKALWARLGRRRRIRPQRRPRHAGHGALRDRLAACVENRRHPRAGARGGADGRRVRHLGRAVAGRPGARAVAVGALFPRALLPGRLLDQSAQLRARPRRRGGGRRRPHLRGHPGAGDRSGRRAKARRHRSCAGPRLPGGAGRQRPSARAHAAVRQHAAADLQHRHRHRADARPAGGGDPLSRRGERRGDTRRPSLPRRRRPADVVRPERDVARQSAPPRRGAGPADPAHLSGARRHQGRARLDRRRRRKPCTACRRSARSRPGCGCSAASAATALPPPPWPARWWRAPWSTPIAPGRCSRRFR